MRALIAVVLALAVGACGDNVKLQDPPVTPDAAPDAPPDGPDPNPVAPCLDHPNNLPQPGSGLPCELIPPSAAFQR